MPDPPYDINNRLAHRWILVLVVSPLFLFPWSILLDLSNLFVAMKTGATARARSAIVCGLAYDLFSGKPVGEGCYHLTTSPLPSLLISQQCFASSHPTPHRIRKIRRAGHGQEGDRGGERKRNVFQVRVGSITRGRINQGRELAEKKGRRTTGPGTENRIRKRRSVAGQRDKEKRGSKQATESKEAA